MFRPLLFATVGLAALAAVHGYGSGAPKDACEDMVPQHHTPAQTSAFPYIVTVTPNKKNIRAGDKIQLTITPDSSVKSFKGFLIQARVGDEPVGKFSAGGDVKVIDCGVSKENTATHVKANEKTKVTLTWTAPPNLSETVRFYVTVAKNGGEFWVKVPTTTLTVRKQ